MNWNNYKNKLLDTFNGCKTFALLSLCLGTQLMQAQNSCNTALPITAGTTVVPAIDGANSTSSCSNASMAEWFVYTPTQNYSVTVTSDLLVNMCKDTNFNIYTGSCNGLVCYGGDDDSGLTTCDTGSTYLSTDTFDAFAGNTYYIAWDNRWSPVGFEFQLIEAPFVPSPCFTATPVTPGTTTVAAIDGNNLTTACSSATMAKWYMYTPALSCHVTISSDLIANICKDTNFSVYSGSCSTGLTCVASDDNSGNIACNSGNTNSSLSTKTFDVNGGTTYFIVWDNKWSAAGFDFQITETPIIVPIHYTSQGIATVNSEYNLCIVDMNGDHKDDIAGVSNNNLRIHYQGEAGTFTISDFPIAGASMMPSWSLAAGDMNKDGYNDLLLGSSSGLSFWKSNATGTAYTNSTPGDYIFCQRTNFSDINNDGHLDAFSCHDVAPNCYYLNDGSNNFTFYQSGVTPGAVSLGNIGGNYATIWTDFDNDGDSDMFVSKCSGPPCEIHLNNGNGTYTDVSAFAQINFTPVSSWSSAVMDMDNDGDMDIMVGSNGGTPSRLFRNNVDSGNVLQPFTNVTIGSGWDTNSSTNRDYIAYDFDNDGFVDIMGGGAKIMFNLGDGSFSPTNYPGMGIGAVGDLNDDGFLDILNNSTVRYAVPNGNNWTKIALQGIQSNSNGIGARIEIHGAWGVQIRDVRSGEGFGYMSSLNTIFGIGTATEIESIIIKWPSGIVDTLLNVQPDINLLVVEGSTLLGVGQMTNGAFSVYPNPASDVLNIKLVNNITLNTAQIFDLSGRLVSSPQINNETIDIKKLASGTYILSLKDADGKQFTQKFLKK